MSHEARIMNYELEKALHTLYCAVQDLFMVLAWSCFLFIRCVS